MYDPLSLLKAYYVHGKKILDIDGHYIFGYIAYPKTVETNYVICRTDEDKTYKEYYTLETLLFLLKNIATKYSNYSQLALEKKIPVVHRADLKVLLLYLSGLLPTSTSVDKTAPVPLFTKIIQVDVDNFKFEEFDFEDEYDDHDGLIISDKIKLERYDPQNLKPTQRALVVRSILNA